MKNDELLDLITEFKPDDTFVEEALGEREGAPVRVYAGKRSPMRIVAPIAACLAVAAAAGIVFANVNRGKLAIGPAASIEESSEVDETSEPVINEPKETKTFLEKCKDIVTAELTDGLPDDAEWVEVYYDIDFDGEDELLLCPHVHRMKLDGVPGVRVFKDNGADGIIDLGSYHLADDCVAHFHDRDFRGENDEIISTYYHGFDYIDEANKKLYYFAFDEAEETSSDTIYEVSFNEATGMIEEKEYLRFVTTYPEDESSSTPFSDAAYRYGVKTDTKAVLDEWKTIPNIPHANCDYGRMSMIKILDILNEKYDLSDEEYDQIMRPYRGVTVYADDGKACFAVGVIDANDDGKCETFVEVSNCDKLRGIYFFEKNNGEIDLIGSFDPNGERIDRNLRKYVDGDDSFYLYRTRRYEKRARDDGSAWETEKYEVHKIVVNEDGSLGEEVILSYGAEFAADGSVIATNQINGNDVTSEEAVAEWDKIVENINENSPSK